MPSGGARPGAGRPVSGNRKISLTLRLLPETLEMLNRLAEKECTTRGEVVDSLVLKCKNL